MVEVRVVLSGRVLTSRGVHERATVVVDGGRVVAVSPGLGGDGGEGWTVAPGFVDLQVNGFRGADAGDGADAIEAISDALPATGVTAFLPTLISAPLEAGRGFVDAAAAARQPGARVLGAHLEGPFLSPRHAGAHDPGQLLQPEADAITEVLRRPPRVMTMAPELPGAPAAFQRLAAAGVVVAAGHSGATAEEAEAGFAAGVRFVTHLFNAMAPLHHREPGLAGAALAAPAVVAGLIADGVHVDRRLLTLSLRAKGARGIALTTDQTAAAGMPPGRHRLGGIDVQSDGRAVRLADGTLAGSAATMDLLVREMVAAGAPVAAALRMASATPARLLGFRRPSADLVLLDPELRPRLTLVGGEVRFRG